jgi:hypothetical protein
VLGLNDIRKAYKLIFGTYQHSFANLALANECCENWNVTKQNFQKPTAEKTAGRKTDARKAKGSKFNGLCCHQPHDKIHGFDAISLRVITVRE